MTVRPVGGGTRGKDAGVRENDENTSHPSFIWMNRGDLYKQTEVAFTNCTYNGELVANRGTAVGNPGCMEARLGQTKKKSQKENLHFFI